MDTCVFAYNKSRHESTCFNPFELMFGRHATIPIDINLQKASPKERAGDFFNCKEPDLEQLTGSRTKQLEEAKQNILKAQKKQKEVYDKKHANPMHYKVGQLVMKKDFTLVREMEENWKLDFWVHIPSTVCYHMGPTSWQILQLLTIRESPSKQLGVTSSHTTSQAQLTTRWTSHL